MKEHKMKTYTYKCKCGYVLNVFLDYGVPQEVVKCRKCVNEIKREENL